MNVTAIGEDEQELRQLVLREGYGTDANIMPRYLAQRLNIPEKRADYIFGKWDGKGWYEYGTVVDGGWLTDKGKEVFSNEEINDCKPLDSVL